MVRIGADIFFHTCAFLNACQTRRIILKWNIYSLRLPLRYFVDFPCHVSNYYIEGLLTARAVAHKWFRDVRHAREM